MYAHLDGTLTEMGVDYLVIDCGGVGYYVTVTNTTLQNAPSIGERMFVETILSVREDAMELFGFSSKEEKRMFERLRGVSGIGAKTAIAVLGALGVQGLSIAIAGNDAVSIARAPGVGKKTAQRIILELRDKVTEADLTNTPAAAPGRRHKNAAEAEAIEALLALGYSTAEAAQAMSAVSGQSDDPGILTGLALKAMGGNGQ